MHGARGRSIWRLLLQTCLLVRAEGTQHRAEISPLLSSAHPVLQIGNQLVGVDGAGLLSTHHQTLRASNGRGTVRTEAEAFRSNAALPWPSDAAVTCSWQCLPGRGCGRAGRGEPQRGWTQRAGQQGGWRSGWQSSCLLLQGTLRVRICETGAGYAHGLVAVQASHPIHTGLETERSMQDELPTFVDAQIVRCCKCSSVHALEQCMNPAAHALPQCPASSFIGVACLCTCVFGPDCS